jgi:alpha-glucosidase (family GH31 glycosyl hydrolase)
LVLKRSTNFGSQRYGDMWTGESQFDYTEIQLYIQEALSLSVSGMIFTGAYLPIFVGKPSD